MTGHTPIPTLHGQHDIIKKCAKASNRSITARADSFLTIRNPSVLKTLHSLVIGIIVLLSVLRHANKSSSLEIRNISVSMP